MYLDKKEYTCPPDDTIIWRYMDFAKFVSLLEMQSLFFCRADALLSIDPYEGSYTKAEKERQISDIEEMNNLMKAHGDASDIESLRIMYDGNHESMLGTNFINCWHINNYENLAMWKVFTTNNNGIAIKTTFDKLKKSLSQTPEEIIAGVVSYVDYETDGAISTLNNYIMRKNVFYQYEKELRLIHRVRATECKKIRKIIDNQEVFLNIPKNPENTGLLIGVDLNEIINEIYVDPKADEWFVKLVEDVLKTYKCKQRLDIKPNVFKSDLSRNIIYEKS